MTCKSQVIVFVKFVEFVAVLLATN